MSDAFGVRVLEAISGSGSRRLLSLSRFVAVLIPCSIRCAAQGQDLSPNSYVQQGSGISPTVELITAAPEHARITASILAQYNSDVTLNDANAGNGSDFILTESLGVTNQWQLSDSSSISLDVTVGYENYLRHSSFSGLTLNVGGGQGITLGFATGRVKWTLYDRPSYTQDPAQNPELSGVGKYASFTNSAGINADLPMGAALDVTLGYEMLDYVTTETSSATSSFSQDHVSHSFRLSSPYQLNPATQAGMSASVTITQYQDQSTQNSTAFSFGPFLKAQLTAVTTAYLTGGSQTVSNAGGGPGNGSTTDSKGFYGEAIISNRPNPRFSHQLDLGRETQLGIISNTVTDDYVRYSATLGLGPTVSLNGNAFIEHGQEMGGLVGETFNQFGGGLSLGLPLARTINLTIGCQWTQKDSNVAGRSYSQYRLNAGVDWVF